MIARKGFLIAVICLFLGFITAISLAQQGEDEFLTGNVGAGAKLVVTSVSGPTKAFLNQTISVNYQVKNNGDTPSEAYEVGLYLSRNKTINPAWDRLLKKVSVANGLTPGQVRKRTTKVIVPNSYLDALSGDYYYGAIVESSKKASSKQVAMARYKANGDGTVTDFKTGLMWQQADDATERGWNEAWTYCDNLVLGGHEDWSLPPVDALETIVDYSRSGPAIDPVFNCRSDYYWSSSTPVNITDCTWTVDFDHGFVALGGLGIIDNYDYVRCVRGGP